MPPRWQQKQAVVNSFLRSRHLVQMASTSIDILLERKMFDPITRNDVPGLQKALASGLNPSFQKYDGTSLLHQACAENKTEIVKVLLEYKVNANIRDACGRTPLHNACEYNSAGAVQLLVAYGMKNRGKSEDFIYVQHHTDKADIT